MPLPKKFPCPLVQKIYNSVSEIYFSVSFQNPQTAMIILHQILFKKALLISQWKYFEDPYFNSLLLVVRTRFYTCRPSVVVCTVAECSYCGFEDSRLLKQKSMSFSRKHQVREAGERERRVIQGLWEVYQYRVRHNMHWTLWIFHIYHHFFVELKILQRFEFIAQANLGLKAYAGCQ